MNISIIGKQLLFVKILILGNILCHVDTQTEPQINLIQTGPSPPSGSPRGEECDTSSKVLQFTYSWRDESKYPGGHLEVLSDNCPGYDWTSQTTPNTALKMEQTLYFL
jgi:hypothetical protein